jgi:O-antigen ligase
MSRILANPVVMITILVVALAGDFVRNLIGIPAWGIVLSLGAIWGVLVVITNRVRLRDFPTPLLLVVGWWVISPAWSPYWGSSLEMLLALGIAAVVGTAMVTVVPLDVFINRGALALRFILASSLAFELGVALSGAPLYPIGYVVTPATPIEAAWSRGEFFDLGARIQGIVGNANVLGMLALVALIVAGWRAFNARTWRTVSTVDAALAAIVIVRTASATVTVTIVGLVVVIAITALARRPDRVSRIALVGTLVSIAAAAVFAIVRWTTVAALLGKSPDLTHRFDIWTAVLHRVAERPITGFGFVGWWPIWDPWFAILHVNGLPVSQAHNVWVDLLMQTGIIGTVLFAFALTSIVVPLWKGFRDSATSLAAVPFLITAALCVQSLTESRLLHEWGLMALFGFAIIARRLSSGFTSRP